MHKLIKEIQSTGSNLKRSVLFPNWGRSLNWSECRREINKELANQILCCDAPTREYISIMHLTLEIIKGSNQETKFPWAQ